MNDIPDIGSLIVGDVVLFEYSVIDILLGDDIMPEFHFFRVFGCHSVDIYLCIHHLERVAGQAEAPFDVIGLQVNGILQFRRIVENHHVVVLYVRETRQPVLR